VNKPARVISIIFIILLAFILRDQKHGYWVDEYFPFNYVNYYMEHGIVEGIEQYNGKEALATIISVSLGLDTPEKIRGLYKVCGLLLVALVPLIFREWQKYLPLMLIFACSPLLIYWSCFARPYIVAAMFVLLAWKYPPFIILAVLTNPLAIVGINLFKVKQWWLFYLILFIGAIGFFLIQPLPHSGLFNSDFLMNARRIYVIPFVVACLYIYTIPNIWLQRVQLYAVGLVKHTRS